MRICCPLGIQRSAAITLKTLIQLPKKMLSSHNSCGIASNELGIGVAQKDVNDQHCWFIVARYRPQGNKDGKEEFKGNVKKGTFDPIVNNCVSMSDEM